MTGPGAYLDRLFTWVQVMFVAVDQFFATWFRGIVFVWFNGEQPNPDETFSSWIGRCQRDGHKLGNIAAKVINFFMGQNHCFKAIGK